MTEADIALSFLDNRAEECLLDGPGWAKVAPDYRACARVIRNLVANVTWVPPYKDYVEHVLSVRDQLWAEREKPGANCTALRQGGSLLEEMLDALGLLRPYLETKRDV
jgi:hypothetical protein